MISSTIKHYRHRNVDMKTVLAFSITAVPLSYVFARYKARINDVVPLTTIIAGAIVLSVITLIHRLTHIIPKKPLRIIILVLLFIAALAIIFKNGKHDDPCAGHEHAIPGKTEDGSGIEQATDH